MFAPNKHLNLINLYPSNSPFIASNFKPDYGPQFKPNLVIGDFYSYSSYWGYDKTNDDGETVEI